MNKKVIGNCIIALFLCASNAFAAKYYWVGDGGSWTDLSHWANTSGGTGDAYLSEPSGMDTVLFDENSFSMPSQVVTRIILSFSGIEFKAMDWTGVTNNPEFN